MNELIKYFNYENTPIRTVLKDDEIWFAVRDVCDVLGINKTSTIVERLDKDECGKTAVIDSQNRQQEIYIMSESGLYEAIIRSNKPDAKKFQKWITKEVIPSIRKHGLYAKDELLNNPELLLDVAQKLVDEKNIVKQLQKENETLKPKAKLFDELTSTEGLYNFKQMADVLGLCGRNTLMKILRECNVLSSSNYNKNLPYSQFEKQGLFKVKITPRKTYKGLEQICTTLCTQKSIQFIDKILKEKTCYEQAK